MIDTDKIMKEIKIEEGVVKSGELHVIYLDSLGYMTIGSGILIDPEKGGGLYDIENDFILKNRIKLKTYELKNKISFFNNLNDTRQRALVNMAFQMGVRGVLGFKKMLQAMSIGDFDRAYLEAIDSRWYNQTPNRSKRVAKLIKTGE